ncbi:MAG: cupin domain-containing protein [Isosphaeraceae bacterium]|nr:cupin domain-containing protein [Isosphaeraceae bacterium]
MTDFTRRGFLGTAALVAGAVGIEAAAAEDDPRSYKHKEDLEALPNFHYAMEASHARVTEGGSAREATIKQLPISKGLAGVSMRLKPGGIRELHWHAIAAEWAFVIKGRVRTTVIGPDGVSETNDFNPGDVWYFPRGHGHLLQNISAEECHFILIFDDGAFSEFGTFSSTDWLGHTPPHVLAKSLGIPASAFARFPKEELYIVNGRTPSKEVPPNHAKMQKLAPNTHRYPLMDQEPYETFRGGIERRVTVKEFPISTTMSGVVLNLDPGAVREPHWHPNADEWQYIISGHCHIGVFGSSGRSRIEEFHQGDAGYVPRGYGHYIENASDREQLQILIGFNHGQYEEISLSTWLAANPEGILADNFRASDDLVQRLPDHRVFIASKDGPGV